MKSKKASQSIASEMTGSPGVGAGGTTTSNMPFDKLIAPSSPKSRDDEDELPSNVLAVVRQVVPVSETWECVACLRACAVDGACAHCGYDPGPSKLGEEMQIQRGVKEPHRVLRVPLTRQTTNFCAPAAAQSVLGFWGIHATESEVADAMGSTHQSGTDVAGVVAGFASFGLRAQIADGGNASAMKKLVDAGIPVLIFWFGHGRRGDGNHASVLVGYDDENVWLMDPEVGMVVPKQWKKFLGSWFTFDGEPSKESIRVGEYVVVTR